MVSEGERPPQSVSSPVRSSNEGAELMAGSGAVLEAIWRIDPRSEGICRPYSAIDVERLRGTVRVEYAIARAGAERLWKLLDSERFLQPLDTTTGEQAVERGAAGLLATQES